MQIIFNKEENNISISDFNSEIKYNIKDISIILPVESDISKVYALLGSEKMNLKIQDSNADNLICSLDFGEKVYAGGVTSFSIYINETQTNILSFELNPFTPFIAIYNFFFEKITDDMYMELTQEDTYHLVKGLLLEALQHFEFPRVNIYDFDKDKEIYNIALSNEEIDIIATYMVMHWLGQQLATVELTRMKYSGSDFKFTSQANHMAKLQNLKKEYERMGFHLQRLYKRRKADEKGIMRSTFGSIMEASFNKR